MVVLDTLTSTADDVNRRWVQLLTNHGVPDHDARVIYAVRNSILHGYGPPRPEKAENRTVRFIGDPAAHAVDTRTPRVALINVPAFCSRLVERIAAKSSTTWNTEELDTRFGKQVT
ncbi:hypothetical protein [Paractinoplanes brasiliensis]|uniref:hypothetical protein n=1 Tax=Paractinoplanes brasiliensis TaxID=52695 RepID=UPI00105C9DF6|nr:hypothetical protein [Actinoplanes brasiliensis]GID29135.1 hypothetical protein Abr02nite_41180 [Actinoplanes brasiliensis]